jgi:polar amino acid transport system permease protein
VDAVSLTGFVWNVAISVVAMGSGTGCRYLLACLRLSKHRALLKTCGAVAELMRNAPTFIFPFYLVFMLPGELLPPFTTLGIPSSAIATRLSMRQERRT